MLLWPIIPQIALAYWARAHFTGASTDVAMLFSAIKPYLNVMMRVQIMHIKVLQCV